MWGWPPSEFWAASPQEFYLVAKCKLDEARVKSGRLDARTRSELMELANG